ncbi:hypothetical protein ACFW1F_07570 [Streptomyces bungoensis]|uniref:hypothetical protein n=1 Tax=Streptomyces bungoensis TaxID=285568 RepID=UPI0036C5A929
MNAKVQNDPLDLPLPESWPKPHAGCDVCATLTRDRVTAQTAGDYSAVTDYNVEIRAHRAWHQRRRR